MSSSYGIGSFGMESWKCKVGILDRCKCESDGSVTAPDIPPKLRLLDMVFYILVIDLKDCAGKSQHYCAQTVVENRFGYTLVRHTYFYYWPPTWAKSHDRLHGS